MFTQHPHLAANEKAQTLGTVPAVVSKRLTLFIMRMHQDRSRVHATLAADSLTWWLLFVLVSKYDLDFLLW